MPLRWPWLARATSLCRRTKMIRARRACSVPASTHRLGMLLACGSHGGSRHGSAGVTYGLADPRIESPQKKGNLMESRYEINWDRCGHLGECSGDEQEEAKLTALEWGRQHCSTTTRRDLEENECICGRCIVEILGRGFWGGMITIGPSLTN